MIQFNVVRDTVFKHVRCKKRTSSGAVSRSTGDCSGSSEIAQWNRINPRVRCSPVRPFRKFTGAEGRGFPPTESQKRSRIILTASKGEITSIILLCSRTQHSLKVEHFSRLLHSVLVPLHLWIWIGLRGTTWIRYAVLPGGNSGRHRDAGLLLRVHRHVQPSRAGLQLQGPDSD